MKRLILCILFLPLTITGVMAQVNDNSTVTAPTRATDEQVKAALAAIDPSLSNPVAEAKAVDEGELSSEGSIRIIPRLDLLSTSQTPDVYGASGFYTFFQGNIAEHFYWNLSNWWLAPPVDGDWGWLYTSLGRTDTTNWLLLCNIGFEWSGWSASFGKDALLTDGFEMDNYDWEVVTPFYTPLWAELPCYQWSGKLGWTSKSGMTSFNLQAASSPLKEKIFSGGCYSVQYRGEYAWFSPIVGCSAAQRADNGYDWWFNAAVRLTFGDWRITGEWSNFTGLLYDENLNVLGSALGNSARLSLDWTPNDIVTTSAVGEYNDRFWLAGAYVEFSPFDGRWREAVSFNAAFSYRKGQEEFDYIYSTGPMFTLGAVMDLCLNLW